MQNSFAGYLSKYIFFLLKFMLCLTGKGFKDTVVRTHDLEILADSNGPQMTEDHQLDGGTEREFVLVIGVLSSDGTGGHLLGGGRAWVVDVRVLCLPYTFSPCKPQSIGSPPTLNCLSGHC